MASWTPQQQAAMDAVLAGTHDMLDTTPRVQPGYTLNQIYGGILPESPAPAASPSYGSPYMTADEQAVLNRQIAASKAMQGGYTATPTAVASVPLPRARPWDAPTSMDLAAINTPKTPLNKALAPTASLDDLLAYAKTLPDKPAVKATAKLAAAQPSTGLMGLLGAGGTAPQVGGIGSLLAAAAAPTTITGTNTGRQYNIGQTYTSGGYLRQATPTGFVTVGKDQTFVPADRNAGMTNAQRIATGIGVTPANAPATWGESSPSGYFGSDGGWYG